MLLALYIPAGCFQVAVGPHYSRLGRLIRRQSRLTTPEHDDPETATAAGTEPPADDQSMLTMDQGIAVDRLQAVAQAASGIPFSMKAVISVSLLFCFWGGGYYLTSSLDVEFDPDYLLLLERVRTMDSPTAMGDIIELPQLSPAEQLVDIIFGPPGYKGNQ